MSYQITGTIYKVKDTQTFPSKKEGGKDFKKRAFVVEVVEPNNEYTQKIELEFIQDKCNLLDNYQVGQEVLVDFNLKGREWDGGQKGFCYFNTLQAWKIKVDQMGQLPAEAPQVPPCASIPNEPVAPQTPPVMPTYQNESEEEVPF
jgi:hypothetical protein